MAYIEHWHIWLIFAFIILVAELMSGTFFLLALAGGALLTSLVTLWLDPTITMQFLSFALMSIATYILLLFFRQEKTDLNNDGTTHMIGQQVKVIDEIRHQGRVTYKGVLWQAKSDAVIAVDSYAEIVAVDGSTLTVKPLS